MLFNEMVQPSSTNSWTQFTLAADAAAALMKFEITPAKSHQKFSTVNEKSYGASFLPSWCDPIIIK